MKTYLMAGALWFCTALPGLTQDCDYSQESVTQDCVDQAMEMAYADGQKAGFDEGFRRACDSFLRATLVSDEGYQCVFVDSGSTSSTVSTSSVPMSNDGEFPAFEALTGE